ncbi:MAG: response regulator transcription factor [Burkholderiaceae bacterium]
MLEHKRQTHGDTSMHGLHVMPKIPEMTVAHQAGGSFLIVDQQPLVRESLHSVLAKVLPGARTELAIDRQQLGRALAEARGLRLAITDLHLDDQHGLGVLTWIREQRPDLPVVVFTGDDDPGLALRCISAGAVGFIPKTYYQDMIGEAIRQILAGQTYLPRRSLAQPRHDVYDRYGMRPALAPQPGELNLTERQTEVLGLILDGMPNKLICRRLQLAEGTVKVHVSNVLRALGVRNRTQAVIAASRMGLRLPRRERGEAGEAA